MLELIVAIVGMTLIISLMIWDSHKSKDDPSDWKSDM